MIQPCRVPRILLLTLGKKKTRNIKRWEQDRRKPDGKSRAPAGGPGPRGLGAGGLCSAAGGTGGRWARTAVCRDRSTIFKINKAKTSGYWLSWLGLVQLF